MKLHPPLIFHLNLVSKDLFYTTLGRLENNFNGCVRLYVRRSYGDFVLFVKIESHYVAIMAGLKLLCNPGWFRILGCHCASAPLVLGLEML